jgi:hypothetical protein
VASEASGGEERCPLSRVAEPDPHGSALFFEPDPHKSEKLDPHPHENQNSEALEAQNRAVEVGGRSQ